MVLTYHEGVHIKCMDVVFTDYEAQVKIVYSVLESENNVYIVSRWTERLQILKVGTVLWK